jgi:hypothetical protein
VPETREDFVDIRLLMDKIMPDKILVDPVDTDESSGNKKDR